MSQQFDESLAPAHESIQDRPDNAAGQADGAERSDTDAGPASDTDTDTDTDADTFTNTGTGAPETGDLVIDAALRDLAEAPADDLDAQIERGEQVQRTLQGRLSDLGG